MAQLLKVYSDNAPPGVEPFIARIVIPEDGTELSVIWGSPTTGAGRRIVIDWGDGTTEEINTFPSTENIHDYAEAGEYFIKIWVYGDILYGPGACLSVLRYAVECVQWGSGRVQSFRFEGCRDLVTVPNFLPDYVRSCLNMFVGCENFNQPLNDWDVSNVTYFAAMFYECNQYNQPLDKWNVSNGTSFRFMFGYSPKFNQPLDKWNVSNGTNFDHMFYRATLFSQDLSPWCVSKVSTAPTDFSFGSALTPAQLPVWGTCPGNP